MSAKINIDIDEVKKFRHTLKVGDANMMNAIRRINISFRNLGNSWKDSRYKKMEMQIKEMTMIMKKFHIQSEENIKKLGKMINELEQYHKAKF